MGELPFILEKANRLARIDRYLSGVEEFAFFFVSVQQMPSAVSGKANLRVGSPSLTKDMAKFEASRMLAKIEHEQKLCQKYQKQFETLVQMVSLTATALLLPN